MSPLWICLRLPRLPLEVFRPRWCPELPVAVLDGGQVCVASASAHQAGVQPHMRRGGVLAVAPRTLLYTRAPEQEEALRERVAMALLQFTPCVATALDEAVLLEVSGSLRLFGGMRALCRLVRQTAQQLGCSTVLSCAPTAHGAWLLARGGHGTRRTVRLTRLHARLDTLPTGVLPEAGPEQAWLAGLGCRTLGALRRLPRAGLRRRCGPAMLDALDRAYGDTPALLDWLEAPPTFHARAELPDRMTHAEHAQHAADGLLAQMLGWLQVHQYAVTHYTLYLEHERGRQAIAPTALEIALAEPTWQHAHLTRLLRERLAKLVLTAPILAVGLSVTQVQARAPLSETLFPEPGGTAQDHARLLELLAARLGPEHVLRARPQADHRPERANHWEPATLAVPRSARPASHPTTAPPLPRPAWLLDAPIPLAVHGHAPHYGTPLRLMSPPERIESGWWDGDTVMRDYYVAMDDGHACYWIYRERRSSQDHAPARWYLHGLFG
ncbi:DNA polymerase Y family protein [Imbroritus primus]|uniref:DNA polymerase Y family protein n=1 Tax=Imbroritus primus TaxID=3058603 RepID=A0ACD3SK30_9BURK|nr:DNA polymerase Y family protein [Burkholderiaceae bacterium PBA]